MIDVLKGVSSVIGWVIIVASVLLGIYVGAYIMFYGGIVQIVNGFTMSPVSAIDIATGICKVLFCELSAIIPLIGAFIGGAFIEWGL